MAGIFDSGGVPIPIRPPFNLGGGFTINITPGNPNYDIELYRSPDNGSGSPNLSLEVMVQKYLAPVKAGGVQYTEQTGWDATYRHFRARHVRSDSLPGAYTSDLRVKPIPLYDAHGPLPPPEFSVGTVYPLPPATIIANPTNPTNYVVASVPSLPTLPDTAYPTNIFATNVADGNTYQNQAGVWVRVGYLPPASSEFIQIVGVLPTLPSASYPQGAVVFYTVDNKLYRSTGSTWSTAVDSTDLTANSVTTNAILAGAVTAAKINVTQLSAISTDTGLLKAGALQDAFSPNTLYEIRLSAGAASDPDTVDGMQTYIDFPASTNFMRVGKVPLVVHASTSANPSVVTVTTHNLVTGNMVTIRGHLGNSAINGTWPVTVLTNDTFTVPVAGSGTGTADTGHMVKLSMIIVGGTGTESGDLKVYGDVQAATLTGLGIASFLGGLRSITGGALFRSLQHSTAGEYGDQTVRRVVLENDALVLRGDAGPIGAGVGMDLETLRIGSYSVATTSLTARSSKDITGQTAGSKGWTDPDGSDNGKNTISFSGNGGGTIAGASRLWQKLGDSATEGDSVNAYDDNYKLGFIVDAHYLTGGNPNAVVTSTVQVEYSTDASFATWTTLAATYVVHAGGTSSGYPSSAGATFTPTVSVPGNPTHVGFRLALTVSGSILDSTYHTGTGDGSVYCYTPTYRSSNFATTWSTSTGASQYRRGLKLPKVASPQQLLNRDFELGSVNWVTYAGTTAVITDATKAHTGSNYLQVTTSGANFGGSVQSDNQGLTAYFPVTPGDVVTFGGWGYRESGTSLGHFVLNTYDSTFSLVTNVSGSTVGAAAWTQLSDTYTIPASGVAYVALFAEVNNVTTTVMRFDDASLIIGQGNVPHLYMEPADVVADPVDGLDGELQFVGGGVSGDGPHALHYHDGEKMRAIARTLLAANAATSAATTDFLITTCPIKARRMNKVGRVLRVRWSGRAASGGSVVTLKIAGVTWVTLTVTANQSWHMDYTFTTGTTGASGTLDGGGFKVNQGTVTTDDGTTAGFDLTADFNIDFYVHSTSGTLTSRVATVTWEATQ